MAAAVLMSVYALGVIMVTWRFARDPTRMGILETFVPGLLWPVLLVGGVVVFALQVFLSLFS